VGKRLYFVKHKTLALIDLVHNDFTENIFVYNDCTQTLRITRTMLRVPLCVFKWYFKGLHRGNFHLHRKCSKVKSILLLMMIISKQHLYCVRHSSVLQTTFTRLYWAYQWNVNRIKWSSL